MPLTTHLPDKQVFTVQATQFELECVYVLLIVSLTALRKFSRSTAAKTRNKQTRTYQELTLVHPSESGRRVSSPW